MAALWETPRYRFGFSLGDRLGHAKEQALGWAVLEMTPPNILATGEIDTPDPIQAMIDKYRALEAKHGPGDGIELYYYSADSFRRSRAFARGISMKDHEKIQRAAAQRLHEAGIPVYWVKVK